MVKVSYPEFLAACMAYLKAHEHPIPLDLQSEAESQGILPANVDAATDFVETYNLIAAAAELRDGDIQGVELGEDIVRHLETIRDIINL